MCESTQAAKWAKQALLTLTSLLVGVSMGLRGPFLVDIEEHYSTSISTMGKGLALGALCRFLASYAVGRMICSCATWPDLALFMACSMLGISSVLMPIGNAFWTLCSLICVSLATAGAIQTGIALLRVDMWRGRSDLLAANAVAYAYALGLLAGAIVAKQFLTDGEPRVSPSFGPAFTMMGIVAVCMAVGYLSCCDRNTYRNDQWQILTGEDRQDSTLPTFPSPSGWSATWACSVATLAASAEFLVITFAPHVCIRGDFAMSRQDAATHFAVFAGHLGLARAVTVTFNAHFTQLVWVSLVGSLLTATASTILIISDSSSFATAQLGYALMGLGLGPVEDSVRAWARATAADSPKVDRAVAVGAGLGPPIASLVLSFFVQETPQSLLYMHTACTWLMLLSCVGLVASSGVNCFRSSSGSDSETEGKSLEDVD